MILIALMFSDYSHTAELRTKLLFPDRKNQNFLLRGVILVGEGFINAAEEALASEAFNADLVMQQKRRFIREN